MTLNLAIVEAGLQLVPREIQSHPQIKRYAERRMKEPDEVLLDRAYHHAAMQKLARKSRSLQVEKMGRPDIVHNSLLQVLETPLNWENRLRVFVHTQDDHVISINPRIRIPKNYIRFVGLIEQLFSTGRVPEHGDALMQIEKSSLQRLVDTTSASDVLGFSILGRAKLIRSVAEQVGRLAQPLVLIGGFPRGHFSEPTMRVVSSIFKVDPKPLDAWIVAGRFVYDFEWAIGIAQKRVKPENDQHE